MNFRKWLFKDTSNKEIEYDEEDSRTYTQFPRIVEVKELFPIDIDRCLSLCQEQIKETPDLAMAYTWASNCLKKLGRDKDAEQILYSGLPHVRKKSLLYEKLGMLYFDRLQPIQMTEVFVKAISVQANDPTNHTPYLYTREICIGCSEENLAKAIDKIRESIASYDLRPEVKDKIHRLVNPERQRIRQILATLKVESAETLEKEKFFHKNDIQTGRDSIATEEVLQKNKEISAANRIYDDYQGSSGIEDFYAQMSRDLVAEHGPLTKIECISLFPNFEIQFFYHDGASVYSGQRTGKHDIHFLSLGYVGEGSRYAKCFLAAAGFDLTWKEIEAIKPGDIITRKGEEAYRPSTPAEDIQRDSIIKSEERIEASRKVGHLEEGKLVNGIVKSITDYGVFIDLGGIDGSLHITDISWGRVSHPSELFQVGDDIEVVVLSYNQEKEKVSLGLKQKSADPWANIEKKFPVGSHVSGKVVNITDYGAFVELEPGVEGLVHIAEMSLTKRVKHPSNVVAIDETVETIVLDLDKDKRRISLSLKQIESNPWTVVAAKYPPGSIVTGIVRNLTDFGAWIEMEEGVNGLVHISDMSWTARIKHPSEVLKQGEQVQAVLLSIDVDNERLSLGIKQLQPNPWEGITKRISIGDTVEGTIARLTDFGAFVELDKGVEGLLHVSEISQQSIKKPEDVLRIGDKITAKVIKLDEENRRIGLSIKASPLKVLRCGIG
ncbi:MAG: S1 RNA-binding domain-containing protein [Candidatus Babeliaceae bacterium]|nr:S1 RNA-binding domain-containing protein [Candidatus Babeliaceae bacterium]